MIASLDPADIAPWIGLAFGALAFSPRVRASVQNAGRALDTRPILAALVVFVLALGLGAIPTILGHAPLPSIHDEFANLLGADTFAHGRLSNPTPAFPGHFQTVHVLVRPTYASKFPPGLGLALAVGKVLGSTAAGAFGVGAFACAIITIALRNWLPPRWAMLGGLLAATHPLLYDWGQSYWGGGVAMLGGALVLSGVGRALRVRADWKSGAAIGSGLFVLAISRPLEGLIVALICGVFVIADALRRGGSRELLTRAATAMIAVMLPLFAWLGYYNWRVTGKALVMPWMEYSRQAMTTPVFFWQPLPPEPVYPDEKLRQFHARDERGEYEREKRLGYIGRLRWTAREVLKRSFNPPTWWLLTPALLMMLRRSRAVRIALALFFGLLLIHPAITPWMRLQYMGPAMAGWFLALTMSLRRASRWKSGAALVLGLCLAQFVALAVLIYRYASNELPPGIVRARMLQRLEAEPGKQLVLVRYAPVDQSIFEWVYNGADIESQKVIFARSIDYASDRALLEHFKDRAIWILDVAGFSWDLRRNTSR